MKFKDALATSVKMFSSTDFIKRIKEEDELMLAHLDILKQMNRHGYLTTNSQAGHSNRGISVLDNKPYQTTERAYITGFMLETKAVEFIKHMAIHTDKNAIFIPYCNDDVYTPSKLDIPLTLTKKKDETTVHTHMSVVLPQSVWEMYRKESHINKSEPVVFIFCWDTKWNRNASGSTGLFTDIVRVLQLN